MSRVSALWLKWTWRPHADRALVAWACRHQPRSILEIGVTDPARTARLIKLAARVIGAPVAYTAIDLFDARTSEWAPLGLKETHCRLRAVTERCRLTPGWPSMALRQTANSLTGTDLILIASRWSDDALNGAWKYFARMLGAGTSVFRLSADAGRERWREIARDELTILAEGAGRQAA